MTTNKTAPPPYADRVDKAPSASTTLYIEWLKENTGYDVDPTSVHLGRILSMTFQASDENQKRLAEEAAARRARTWTTARKSAAPAPKRKPAAKKSTPAKTAKKAPARAATTRRRAVKKETTEVAS